MINNLKDASKRIKREDIIFHDGSLQGYHVYDCKKSIHDNDIDFQKL